LIEARKRTREVISGGRGSSAPDAAGSQEPRPPANLSERSAALPTFAHRNPAFDARCRSRLCRRLPRGTARNWALHRNEPLRCTRFFWPGPRVMLSRGPADSSPCRSPGPSRTCRGDTIGAPLPTRCRDVVQAERNSAGSLTGDVPTNPSSAVLIVGSALPDVSPTTCHLGQLVAQLYCLRSRPPRAAYSNSASVGRRLPAHLA